MALLEHPSQIGQVELAPRELVFSTEAQYLLGDDQLEQELEARLSPEHLTALTSDYLEGTFGMDWRKQLGDRQYVVAYIPGTDPYSDIGRSVETEVFSESFKLSKGEVVRDYGKYDEASTFVCVIDASTDEPKPVGSLRVTEHKPGLGVKDINDLVVDSPDNPWIDEIKKHHFAPDEQYDPWLAWERLAKSMGVDLSVENTLDVASHAAVGEYRGKNAEIDSVSMLFYHACLRFALAHKKESLLAIYDLKPLANLQQFGDPFDTYDGLEPHPYGGPYDTIPAFCVIKDGMQRIRNKDAFVGSIFIDGATLGAIALMPNEYAPEQYSNEAVNLPKVD